MSAKVVGKSTGERVTLMVGRAGGPTCGVTAYCHLLANAMRSAGTPTKVEIVHWHRRGWIHAHYNIARRRDDETVIVQYTAFNWSTVGLPFRLLPLVWTLRAAGARVGIMFHDPDGQSGRSLQHKLRWWLQRSLMRALAASAHFTVHNVPIAFVDWLGSPATAKYAPVGANVPSDTSRRTPKECDELVIAVFAMSTGKAALNEVEDVAHVARSLSASLSERRVRFLVFGQGVDVVRETLIAKFAGLSNVRLDIRGVCTDLQLHECFAQSHVHLFVRGTMTTQRGSLMAGIAHGLPIVGYRGADTQHPLSEAGLLGVPRNDRTALAAAMVRVVSESLLWNTLHKRSVDAQYAYFSWESIARLFLTDILAPYSQESQRKVQRTRSRELLQSMLAILDILVLRCARVEKATRGVWQ
jgi:glycosyltransferase involved in cell wall biosynthesis